MLVAERWYLMPSTSASRLRAVDRLGGQLDELLRVALEVVQPAAVGQDADDAAAGELGLSCRSVSRSGSSMSPSSSVDRARRRAFPSPPRRLADGEVGLAPSEARLGDRRARSQIALMQSAISFSLSNCTR